MSAPTSPQDYILTIYRYPLFPLAMSLPALYTSQDKYGRGFKYYLLSVLTTVYSGDPGESHTLYRAERAEVRAGVYDEQGQSLRHQVSHRIIKSSTTY